MHQLYSVSGASPFIICGSGRRSFQVLLVGNRHVLCNIDAVLSLAAGPYRRRWVQSGYGCKDNGFICNPHITFALCILFLALSIAFRLNGYVIIELNGGLFPFRQFIRVAGNGASNGGSSLRKISYQLPTFFWRASTASGSDGLRFAPLRRRTARLQGRIQVEILPYTALGICFVARVRMRAAVWL